MTCFGAENETRTRDPNLGKVMLYQLSYFRIKTLSFRLGLQRYALILNFQTFCDFFFKNIQKRVLRPQIKVRLDI